jgi:hypothetical protein
MYPLFLYIDCHHYLIVYCIYLENYQIKPFIIYKKNDIDVVNINFMSDKYK